MESKYHHLSDKDRIFLRIMLEKRYSKTKIAKILGVDRSTIYREIKATVLLTHTVIKNFIGAIMHTINILIAGKEKRNWIRTIASKNMFTQNLSQGGLHGK